MKNKGQTSLEEADHPQNVRFGLVPPRQPHPLRDHLVALFKVGRTTCMNPEHPRVGLLFSDAMGILDCKLRLPDLSIS